MGIKKFRVEFDNSSRCFFPGQTVTGKVVLEVKNNKEINGLIVKFEGKATVSWSEPGYEIEDKEKVRKLIHHRDIEQYFTNEFNLVDNKGLILPAGVSNFIFSYTLPMDIPSSYVGKAGQVYYFAEVKLRIGKSDHKQRIPFSVNGILDLNYEPGINLASEVRNYKNTGCLCYQNGPFGYLFKINKRGYVPGEPIHFIVKITNQTSKKIQRVLLSLIQRVKFHAIRNTYSDSRTIRKISGPPVSKGEIEIWDGDILKIPPLPPTRLTHCRIIDVQYFLSIDIKGIGRKMTGEIPITIGTIPLMSSFRILRPTPPPLPPPPLVDSNTSVQFNKNTSQVQTQVLLSNSNTCVVPYFEQYHDLPPPSYEEATISKETKEIPKVASKTCSKVTKYENEDEPIPEEYQIDPNFTPRYITYSFQEF